MPRAFRSQWDRHTVMDLSGRNSRSGGMRTCSIICWSWRLNCHMYAHRMYSQNRTPNSAARRPLAWDTANMNERWAPSSVPMNTS